MLRHTHLDLLQERRCTVSCEIVEACHALCIATHDHLVVGRVGVASFKA